MFELTKDDVETLCARREDCTGCEFMYQHGICAKDLTAEGTKELKDLFKFLLKEIDYDNIRTVSREMESTQYN